MRVGLLLAVAVVVISPQRVRAEPESAWVAGSFGLGGGCCWRVMSSRARLGPIHASADLEATYWLRERVGVGLVWRGFVSGEGDGKGGNGSLYLATATIRHDWMSSHHGREFPARAYVTIGIGPGHYDGFDGYDGERPFDTWGPAWNVAVGVVGTPRSVLFGAQLAMYGIGDAFAVVPMYVLGFTL